MNARESRIAMIAEGMAHNLKDHQLTVRLDCGLFRSWRCSNPGRSAYHFNVTQEPGRLFVTGDLGILILEREQDMIAWARKSIGDLDHFASKVPQEMPTNEFDDAVAREWIAAQLDDKDDPISNELASELEASLVGDDGTEFYQTLYQSDFCDSGDMPNMLNYTHSFLRCVEGIKWLLARI